MYKLEIPVDSTTLENGLRVVISPHASAPIVTAGVYYNVGFRLEPRGRSGFAHLFEHMMFQGSEHAGKTVHIKLVNASGGVLNGSTHYDVTNYFQAVPSNALERVLWLEADRMRALEVNEANLRNQRDVVKEEVRVNVLNQPYGGFPWLDLPSVAYRNWSNAHNFYGDFADLDAATLRDVLEFFETYYAPNNAVLVLVGDVRPEEGFALACRYFADIPANRPPSPADVSEPPQREERRGEVEEKLGTLPALAIGYHMPERRTRDWYAAAMLDQALHGGRAGRLYRRLIMEKQIAVDVEGGIHYPLGTLFDVHGPVQMVTRIMFKPEFTAEETVAAFDGVITEIAENGIGEEELEAVKVKFRSDYYSTLEGGHDGHVPRYGLMHYLACFTLFDRDPYLVNTAMDAFRTVTSSEVRAAAQNYLVASNRSVLIRRPTRKRAA